jgi:ABC-2 type transport system permease protein
MADVARPVSLADQIGLVAKLRWRILLNGLRRKNNVSDLIGMIFVSLFGAILVIGPAFAFYFAGYSLVSERRMQWLPLPFWGVFVFWQVFPIFAVGFGTGFEFKTLLRFPFSAGAFYLIGLAYGFSDFPAVASVTWLLVMMAGTAVANVSLLPIMLVVVLLFILLNVTVERLIGSWLERLLARRRTRELFFGLFILTMFSLQFISQAQGRYMKKGSAAGVLRVMKYLAPFPPSLSARALTGAIRHDFTDIALGLLGITAFVALFTALLWQRFAAQYRGEELSETAAPSAVRVRAAPSSRLASGGQAAVQIPHTAAEDQRVALSKFVPPILGAMVSKEFSYLIRNGFAFFLLVLPPVQILLFSSRLSGKHAIFGGRGLNADLLFPAMMAYTILVMVGPAYNAFAYEGRGIQTYFTAPVTFADILKSKNILSVAMIAVEVVICGAVLSWHLGLPSVPTLFATAFGLIFTVVAQLPIANWASLNFPRKLQFGSMRSQRNSGAAIWIMFGMQIVIGGISALILWSARWTGNPWLPTEAFAFLSAAAFAGYFASLPALSDFAEKQKEVLMEALCR